MKIRTAEQPQNKRATGVFFEAENDVEAAVLWAQLQKWRQLPPCLEAWYQEVLDLLDEEKSSAEIAETLRQNVTTINNRLAYLQRLNLITRRKLNVPQGGRTYLYRRHNPCEEEIS